MYCLLECRSVLKHRASVEHFKKSNIKAVNTIRDLTDRNVQLSRSLRQKHKSQVKEESCGMREQYSILYDKLREKERALERLTNKYNNLKKEMVQMRRKLTKVKLKCTSKQKFSWRLDDQIAKKRAIFKELKAKTTDIATADNSVDSLPQWLAEMHDSKKIRCVSRYDKNSMIWYNLFSQNNILYVFAGLAKNSSA